MDAVELFHGYLGFGEPHYITRNPGSTEPDMMFIKINDRQYVEFFRDDDNRLVKYRHTGFGFKALFCKDFNGHEVEFLEYTGDGFIGEMKGGNMPDTRISDTFRHVGWICPDSAKDIAFYGYILGFTEFWRGGETPEKINWIKMKLPESTDYVELMLFDHDLPQNELGLLNHMDLDMESVQVRYDGDMDHLLYK